MVKVVETHKAATTFLSTVHGHNTSIQGRMGGQVGWQSNGRAGWISSGSLAGIQPNYRTELETEGLAEGQAGGEAGSELFRDPTV